MLIKFAWRNVWRSRTRSVVVIIAIALGLLAGVFSSAFVEGMMKQKVDDVIDLEMSHFQFHHPKFRDELVSKYIVQNSENIYNELERDNDVDAFCYRLKIMAMMASANHTNGVRITGVVPGLEAEKNMDRDEYVFPQFLLLLGILFLFLLSKVFNLI